MIWGFVWRFVLLAALLAYAFTFAVGFVGRLAGWDAGDTFTAGSVAQGAALLISAVLALGGAQNESEKLRTK